MDSSSAMTDLAQQSLNLTLSDGSTEPVSLADIDDFVRYGIRICINYASQIGATVLLLVVLLLTTRKEKRQTAIFYLNTVSLVCNAIRLILACLYFTGPWYAFYTYFAGDYSAITGGDRASSIIVLLLTLLLHACISGSLLLQVRAVCITLPRIYKVSATLITLNAALAALSVRLTLTIWNARFILADRDFGEFAWLAAANNYATTASICVFSAVFVTKLGHAIFRRRRMGLHRFGPMQVLFIMGCQTLVVPALFAILQNFTAVPELGSQVLTIVALSLPLTGMWAAASIKAGEVEESHSRDNSSMHYLQSPQSGRKKLSIHTRTSSCDLDPRSGMLSSIFAKSIAPLSGKSAKSRVFAREMSSGVQHSTPSNASNPTLESAQSPRSSPEDLDQDLRLHLGRSMV